MKSTDLLVIGGSAGGILSATTARKAYGNINITVIRNTEKVMVPCGIPYIYGTLHSTDKNVIPDAGLLDANIHLHIDQVAKIDPETSQEPSRKDSVLLKANLQLWTVILAPFPECRK